MNTKKINSLDVLQIGQSDCSCAMVFLHGYGANKEDLAPLAQVLSTSHSMTYYFIDAPMAFPIGMGMIGRAWFPLDEQTFFQAMSCGDFHRFTDTIPPGLLEAANSVKGVLEEIKNNHEDLSLGGFSQGSMVSCQIAFNCPELVNRLAILSGTFLNEKAWHDLVPDGHPLHIFQSHGHQDPVLPFSEGKRLADFLQSKCPNHQFVEFSGGHEIPPKVITELAKFLSQ